MRKIVNLVVATFSMALNLENGWHLISFNKNLDTSKIKDNNITSLWSYKNNKWYAYSPNKNYQKLIKENNVSELSLITPNMGVWVQVKGKTKLDTEAFIEDNNISLKKGWNLIGCIAPSIFINEIEPNAIFWKYKNNKWYLGNNKNYNYPYKFDTFSSNEGVWVFATKDINFTEDLRYKFLFLDNDLIPQNVEVVNKKTGIDGIASLDIGNEVEFNISDYKAIKGKKGADYIFSPNIVGSNKDYAVFLEKNSVVELKKGSNSKISFYNYKLDDYILNYYPIKQVFFEAIAITPMISANNVIVNSDNISMDKSITLFLKEINSLDLDFNATFIKGVELSARDKNARLISPDEINGKMIFKPIFLNIDKKLKNPYIYVLNENKWQLVGPAIQIGNTVYSQNYSDIFNTYILVDLNNNAYNFNGKVYDEYGRVLRDAIVVSNNKIVTSTNEFGEFNYRAPQKPQKLIAYKDGYLPSIINSNEIILKKIPKFNMSDGIDISYNKDMNIIFKTGGFIFAKNSDFKLKPKLIANIKKAIYSKVYKKGDSFIVAASDSTIYKIDNNVSKITEGDGIIYGGLNVVDNVIYYATFANSVVKIDKNKEVKELSDEEVSVVYEPLIDENIFIPIYDENISLIVKNKDLKTIKIFKNLGIVGELSKIDDSIVFGSSNSKIYFVSQDLNITSLDFKGSGIIANVIKIAELYYGVDTNGTIKSFTKDSIVNSLNLEKTTHLIKYNDKIIASTVSGIYILDENLNILDYYNFNDVILAKPIVYKNDIYTITRTGKFYKNNIYLGTFNSKVTNINLINDSLIFGDESGRIYNIFLE